jgi:hypothetical protein
MTPVEIALDRIAEARARTDRAVRRWHPADLTRISECRQALLESLEELRELEPVLQQIVNSAFGAGIFVSTSAAAGTSAAKIRSGLLALRSETAHLERLVDSASAFLRGVLLLRGGAAPAYTADGRIQHDALCTAEAQGCGMQG